MTMSMNNHLQTDAEKGVMANYRLRRIAEKPIHTSAKFQ